MREVTLRISEVEALSELYYRGAGPRTLDVLKAVLTRADALYLGSVPNSDRRSMEIDHHPHREESSSLDSLNGAIAVEAAIAAADAPLYAPPDPPSADFSGGGGDFGGGGSTGSF